MWFFTALFGGLMLLSVESRRRMIAIMLIGCIAVLGVVPPPAQAQFCLPCVIQAVLTTISQTIGNWLNSINGVISTIQKLYEQTIWPISAINLAKSQIQSIIAQFRAVIQSIMTINPHTATLPNPVALENIIRNRATGDINSVPQMYVNAFRPVPQAGSPAVPFALRSPGELAHRKPLCPAVAPPAAPPARIHRDIPAYLFHRIEQMDAVAQIPVLAERPSYRGLFRLTGA